MHLERARGLGDLKKGDNGTDFVSATQLRAREAKFKSPCHPFLIKRIYKFNEAILQILKLSFTPKNWLLKFDFACSLAQILEPKLLVHEILEFTWHLS